MAWFILRRNKNLLSNIYTNTKHGNQRMTYLCLKTLLEDVAVANDFFLNYDFNTGNKIKKPDIKKSLDQLNEEFPQLLLDHQFKTYNQLYGHLNRFSHFNFNDLQHQLVPLIQNKPKIIDKTDYINHFLVCFDVFSILQQIYFPFKEIFTEEKETKLKYIHRTDNNDWEYGVPNKMLRKMLRWTRWFDYAKGI